MAIRHAKVSVQPVNISTPGLISSPDWNAAHIVDGSLSFGNMVAPSTPADGDLWLEASGTSPSRTISLKVRDQGVTRVLASITF